MISADVIIEDPRWAGIEAIAEQAMQAVGEHLQVEGEAAILACSDARIAELNAEFREKPSATNVLSWPSEERAAEGDGDAPRSPSDEELGDIAIAYETCTSEADDQGKAFEAHVTHLLIHGCLHLLGYDHERDGDATLMERLEVEILGKLGVTDPYSHH